MEQKPLVSIVTPSFNQGRFIEATIESVLKQTYTNIEHIVVDGGSTDETVPVLKKYGDRIRWVSEKDAGQSDAINKGLKMSRGEVFAWLNSDDTYLPHAVETAVTYLQDHPDTGMVHGDSNEIDASGKVVGYRAAHDFNLRKLILNSVTMSQPSFFFRKVVLDRLGGLDISLHYALDYDLLCRLGLQSKIDRIPGPLANFRLWTGSKTISQSHKFWEDHMYVIDKLFSGGQVPPGLRVSRQQAYGRIYFGVGRDYFAERRLRPARKYFLKALAVNPGQPLETPWLAPMLALSLLGGRATRLASRAWAKIRRRPVKDAPPGISKREATDRNHA